MLFFALDQRGGTDPQLVEKVDFFEKISNYISILIRGVRVNSFLKNKID